MQRFTILEVAEKLDVEREVARGLIKFLVDLELAESMGNRRNLNGRGALEGVFIFVEGFEEKLAAILRNAKLTA